jgi:hypothetical protein
MGYELEDDESILNDIQLPEVLIYREKWIPMQESNFTATKSCTKPILIKPAFEINHFNKGMANLKTNKEKKIL